MRTFDRRRGAAGLTLIEMLVVLMIAGMALMLSYQSLSQWRIAETSLSGLSDEIREQRLGRAWFEASMRGLIPIADEPFSGDAESLSGHTLAAPASTPGGTTSIQWSLQGADGPALQLEEDGEQRLSLALARSRMARFEYIDREGRAHAQWPPALGLHDHLPAAVVLLLERGDDRVDAWVAAIAGTPNPPPIPPMYEADRD